MIHVTVLGSQLSVTPGRSLSEDVDNVLDPFKRVLSITPRKLFGMRADSEPSRKLWNPFKRTTLSAPTSARRSAGSRDYSLPPPIYPTLGMPEVTINDIEATLEGAAASVLPSAPPMSIAFSASSSHLESESSPGSSFHLALSNLNFVLQSLQLGPVYDCYVSIRHVAVVRKQMKEAMEKIQHLFTDLCMKRGIVVDTFIPCKDCIDILASMERRYPLLASKSHRLLMLTCAPISMSIRELATSVKCKFNEARSAMELRKKERHNAFVLPDWKSSAHPLPPEVRQAVLDFYESSDYTRVSPAARDTRLVTHPITGEKELKAKRRIMMNASEFYALFCSENPDHKIGASTFVKLRPKWCHWPGRYGFHNSCCCIIHENFSKKLLAIPYHGKMGEFLKAYLCEEPGRQCYYGVCEKCPNWSKLEQLEVLSDTVKYEQWIQNERAEVVTVHQSDDELVEDIRDDFSTVALHHFIMKDQMEYMDTLKKKIQRDPEIIVRVDFAENYSFEAQDAIAGYHWHKNQATIHPFVVDYYLDGKICEKSIVMISDCLEHSATTYHWFRCLFINELRKEDWFRSIKKINYRSDGAGSQYKNKYSFATLMMHKTLHGVEAEHSFSGTAHGKDVPDAVSATVKGTAARESMKGTRIMSPKQLFDFCTKKLTNEKRVFVYADSKELPAIVDSLRERFTNLSTITGTRRYHSVEVVSEDCLRFRVTSLDPDYKDVKLSSPEQSTQVYAEGVFAALKVMSSFVIGRILRFSGEDEYEFELMLRKGRKNNFVWPDRPRRHTCSIADVLCVLDQPAAVGRTQRYFRLSPQDYKTVLKKAPPE